MDKIVLIVGTWKDRLSKARTVLYSGGLYHFFRAGGNTYEKA